MGTTTCYFLTPPEGKSGLHAWGVFTDGWWRGLAEAMIPAQLRTREQENSFACPAVLGIAKNG